jgi:hypothetical protein
MKLSRKVITHSSFGVSLLIMITIFMFYSDMSELLIVTDCHGLLKNYIKFNKIQQCIKWPQCKHILFTLQTFSGHLIIMWRSKRYKHVHGAMKMCFMKHTSYSFNITSKNTTSMSTWHFLFNILIFFPTNIFQY